VSGRVFRWFSSSEKMHLPTLQTAFLLCYAGEDYTNPFFQETAMTEQSAETVKLHPLHFKATGQLYDCQTALFKKAILAATTPDESKCLARKIYDMAMEGDLTAAKIYFQYALTNR
jgi:hypothetical protein